MQCVCENCNQYFGDNIDRELTRSGLNINKFNLGHKKTFDPAKDFKNQSLTISEGTFKGLTVMFSSKNLKLITPPLNYDFGFRKENGEYDWYTIINLPTKEEVLSYPDHSDWIYIINSDRKYEIIQLLNMKYDYIKTDSKNIFK